jgi:dolichyl-diphosphooligosaccharide--protein glycosyltransferase
LFSFDGSLTEAGSVQYTRYVIRKVPATGERAGNVNGYARVITSEFPVNGSYIPGNLPIVREGSNLQSSEYTTVFSDNPKEPVQKVPALQHYRLIHESANNAIITMFPESPAEMLPDIKQIKIFEYVNGAHIPGNGVIEVPIITNTGRSFIYRQESTNGEFIVPYPTTGNSYNVTATGPYHITGTSRYIAVTEEDVVKGSRITE